MKRLHPLVPVPVSGVTTLVQLNLKYTPKTLYNGDPQKEGIGDLEAYVGASPYSPVAQFCIVRYKPE